MQVFKSRLRQAYCAPWQAKHIYRNPWTMPMRWSKLMLQQRSQAGIAMILMFLPNALKLVMCMYVATYNWSQLRQAYCAPRQAKHIYRNPWTLPMRWSKLMLQQRSQAGIAMILMFLSNSLKLVMCMYVATYNWSQLRQAYCAPWQDKHIYRNPWTLPMRWSKLMQWFWRFFA